ncbi:MAG: TIGR04086 family membrane protein [Bacillota bacterium]|nr:TIGR04086 family membrane protein [Bacillota bacterium]
MRPVRQEVGGWSPGSLVRGAISGLLITLLLLCVLAVTMLWVDIDDRPARMIMDTIGGIGALVAGFVAGRRAEVRGMLHGGAAGLLFTLIVLLIGLLFFGAAFSLSAWVLRLIVGMILGALGGVVGINF